MTFLRSTSAENETGKLPHRRLPALSLAALGIVFGDIGTSPLYTFKTILAMTGSSPDASVILGVLSLVLWTLFIITTVKYVSFAMRIDNDGEGGILALMALLGGKKQHRPGIVALGLFGAALIYGDGAITPAISVLSALEGLNLATPAFEPYIVPGAVFILLTLFAIQPQGTGRIGKAFGPVCLSGSLSWRSWASSELCNIQRYLLLSIHATASLISSPTEFRAFWFSEEFFYVSQELKRSTPIWATSEKVPYGWRGHG
jgi:K+ transporter